MAITSRRSNHLLLLILTGLILSRAAAADGTNATNALPGCQPQCGGVAVPYPFGIGDGCHKEGFDITCNNTSSSPPAAFLGNGSIEVIEIHSDGRLRINQPLAYNCFSKPPASQGTGNQPSLNLAQRPYRFSNSRNKFVGIGCDTVAYLVNDDKEFSTGCVSTCSNLTYVVNGTCSGIGCCETPIPTGLSSFHIKIESQNNHSNCWDFDPCSFGFLADDSFAFDASSLTGFTNLTKYPVTLEWSIGKETCVDAVRKSSSFACVAENSDCYNSTNGEGYRCNCSAGYQGNPYLQDGCQDIDECIATPSPCVYKNRCTNTPGNYTCSCPHGKDGDGRVTGSGCNRIFPLIQLVLGLGLGLLFVLFTVSWAYWALKKRRLIKLKERMFEQNGGKLLEKTRLTGAAHGFEIFSKEELEKATKKYDETRILGAGGFGAVYKGVLKDQRVVAVKKSKKVDESQIEEFINEALVLSRINHRNVVQLLGCCLETAVPLLVYEFVTNGTLFHHLHAEDRRASLSLENRLRIAAETAGALAYMHSSATPPILHRDVKSSNILLDENFAAKVSDFGASRLVPSDQDCLASLVRGTIGYLDPEYMQCGQFSDKSDVYGFGVVLTELLSGKNPVSCAKTKGLANYFISCFKEDRLSDILEDRVRAEGSVELLHAVSEVACRCLKLEGKERPTMAEVALELEGLRRFRNNPWIPEVDDEIAPLIGDDELSPNTVALSAEIFSSNEAVMPYYIER